MEQRATLERWLFEENLGFKKALPRARSELGFAGSMSSLQRFYHRTAETRMWRELAGERIGLDVATTRQAGMEVVGRIFLKQVTENPDGVKEWGPLAKLLLPREDNELRRELFGGEFELRRAGLALARERYEFNAAEAALKQLAKSPELEAEDLAQERAQVLEVKKRLFEKVLPAPEAAEAKEATPQS